MRITPDGRVGIGTSKPEATLDVASFLLWTSVRRRTRVVDRPWHF